MPIDPFQRAMADEPVAFRRILDWWAEGSRGEPPHLTFRAEEFGLRGVHKKPKPLVWPAELGGVALVTASASAGIDSTAAVLLARKRWPAQPMLLVRADTGFEPEDSDAILKILARKVRAATVTLLAHEDLYDLVRAYGRIPNKASSPWCSTGMKGGRLDRFFEWLVRGRKPKAAVHVTGLLACEPGRVEKHQGLQTARFGKHMEEVPILLQERIDKRAAYHLGLKARIPVSDTYEVRRRHGCIPCKWWSREDQWRDFFRVDPAGYLAAADLEEEIERTGKQGVRGPNPIGKVAPKQYRVWLLGRKRAYPKGLNLREWLEVWDAEAPGWRTAPLEFAGLIAAGPLVEPAWTDKELVKLPGRGRSARRSGLERKLSILVGEQGSTEDPPDEIRIDYHITTAADALFNAYWCLFEQFDEADAVPTRPAEPALYIDDVHVPRNRRGARRGVRLVAAAERWARKQGARRAYICATPYTSSDAIGFWRRMGYEVIEKAWDSAVMVKALGKARGAGRAARPTTPATWQGKPLGQRRRRDPFTDAIQGELEKASLGAVLTSGHVSYEKIRGRFPLPGPEALATNEHTTVTGFRLTGTQAWPTSFGGMIYMLREHGGDWRLINPAANRLGRPNRPRRVAFDFDGTLTLEAENGGVYLGPNPVMIAKLRNHAARGDEVWIVTARRNRAVDKARSRRERFHSSGHPLVHAFLQEHQLPVKAVVFTGHAPKGPHLKHHGIARLYDDQEGQRQSAVAAGVQALAPEYPR